MSGSVRWWLVAAIVVVVVGVGVGFGLSGSTTATSTTSSLAPTSTTSTLPVYNSQHNARSSLISTNCGKSSGKWYFSGVLRNLYSTSRRYEVAAEFETPVTDEVVLTHLVVVAHLGAGKTSAWRVIGPSSSEKLSCVVQWVQEWTVQS